MNDPRQHEDVKTPTLQPLDPPSREGGHGDDVGDPVYRNSIVAPRFRAGDRATCAQVLVFVSVTIESAVQYGVKVSDGYLHVPEEEQEDLTQEILFRVLGKRHTYDDKYPVRGWAYAIARNAIIDLHRRADTKRRRLGKPVDPPPPGQPDDDLPSFLTPEVASALGSRDFLRRLLLECAARLEDPVERELIQRVHIEAVETLRDFSRRMMNDRPELTYGACRTREKRAKAKLQSCLCQFEERHPELIEELRTQLAAEQGVDITTGAFVDGLRWARRHHCAPD